MSDIPEQIANPTNMGEVNITLKFMQRDIGILSGLIKDLGGKIDLMPSSFVSIKDFTEARAQSEKDRAELKGRVEHLEEENNKRKEYQDTLTGKMIAMSGITGILIAAITLIVNHLWK
jgi:hypothetical protein